MKKVLQKIFSGLGVTILLGFVGCFASNVIAHPIGNGNIAWWESMGQPSGGAARFVWAETNWHEHQFTVYVETTTGKIFRCCPAGQKGWEETTLKERVKESTCKWYRERLARLTFSNIDVSRVKDCVLMPWTFEWVADDEMYVILEDGSVWKWHHYWGLPQMIGFGCGVPLLVEILGWGTIIFLSRRRQ